MSSPESAGRSVTVTVTRTLPVCQSLWLAALVGSVRSLVPMYECMMHNTDLACPPSCVLSFQGPTNSFIPRERWGLIVLRLEPLLAKVRLFLLLCLNMLPYILQ